MLQVGSNQKPNWLRLWGDGRVKEGLEAIELGQGTGRL